MVLRLRLRLRWADALEREHGRVVIAVAFVALSTRAIWEISRFRIPRSISPYLTKIRIGLTTRLPVHPPSPNG